MLLFCRNLVEMCFLLKEKLYFCINFPESRFSSGSETP